MDDLETYTKRLCKQLQTTEHEIVRNLIEPMFRAKQRDLRLWELRINEYLRTIISEKVNSQ